MLNAASSPVRIAASAKSACADPPPTPPPGKSTSPRTTTARARATVNQDPTRGLKDEREMSSTLVTTEAGSAAAGSEGVSEGATGNPRLGQPSPVPLAANPEPGSLQYVTVYDNGNKGGFAGSEPVKEPENFRCAFNKSPGAQ